MFFQTLGWVEFMNGRIPTYRGSAVVHLKQWLHGQMKCKIKKIKVETVLGDTSRSSFASFMLGRKMLSPCVLQLGTEKFVCTIWNMDHICSHLNFYFAKVEFFPQKGHNGCQRNPHIKFVYRSLNKPFNLQLVWPPVTGQRVLSSATPWAQPRGQFYTISRQQMVSLLSECDHRTGSRGEDQN